MNSFQIIGTVSKVKTKTFDSGKTKTSWTLKYNVGGNKNTFFNCYSWNNSFQQLQNGNEIELTNYVPVCESWEDQTTLQKTYFHTIQVWDAKLINDSVDNKGLTRETPTAQDYNVVDEQELDKMLKEFETKNLDTKKISQSIKNLDNIQNQTQPLINSIDNELNQDTQGIPPEIIKDFNEWGNTIYNDINQFYKDYMVAKKNKAAKKENDNEPQEQEQTTIKWE